VAGGVPAHGLRMKSSRTGKEKYQGFWHEQKPLDVAG
jgi:hypothetical protein